MNTINERLQEIVGKLFNRNNAAFARKIGVAPTTVANYLRNENPSKPTSDILSLIVTELGIDATWLLTGMGEMQKPSQTIRDVSNSNIVGVNVSGSGINISNPEAYTALLKTVNTYQQITQKYQSQLDEIINIIKNKL